MKADFVLWKSQRWESIHLSQFSKAGWVSEVLRSARVDNANESFSSHSITYLHVCMCVCVYALKTLKYYRGLGTLWFS